MDENNFNFTVESDHRSAFHVVMRNGILIIDGVEYEDNIDDPTYPMAREIARLHYASPIEL